jgi:hypothetical protein
LSHSANHSSSKELKVEIRPVLEIVGFKGCGSASPPKSPNESGVAESPTGICFKVGPAWFTRSDFTFHRDDQPVGAYSAVDAALDARQETKLVQFESLCSNVAAACPSTGLKPPASTAQISTICGGTIRNCPSSIASGRMVVVVGAAASSVPYTPSDLARAGKPPTFLLTVSPSVAEDLVS